MRWLRLNLWMLFLLLLVCPNATRAQSTTVPIKAKQRQLSFEIQADGSKVLKHELAGAYYRTSAGSVISTWGDLSTFIDVQGDIIEIKHRKKTAKLVVLRRDPLCELTETKILESIKGYETVSGLYCAVQNAWVDGNPGGNSYVYLPYDLWVKAEVYVGGGSHLLVTELYDIEVAEPDPVLVGIPEGYAIDDQEEQ